MGSIIGESKKSLMLFSGRAFPELAEEIGEFLGVAPTPTDAYQFANGEIFVRYKESVRGSDAFVVQSMCQPVNQWLMESMIMVDALKRGSAKRITVVLRFFDGPVDHLFAMDALAGYVQERYAGRPLTVVAPDSGRVRVAERWTDRLGGCPLAFIHKTRDPLKPNQVVANRVVGEVEGRVALIVDDMIDTGSTIARAAEILFDSGAADVIVAATHALLSDPATERLKNSRISEVVVTNTLPLPPEKRLDKITVLSISPLIARAIREVFDDGSVTTLFGGLS